MQEIEKLGLGEVKTRLIKSYPIRYVSKGSGWQFDTLLEKEPETIEWIDSFSADETLWDIGANVGIYSIYAALQGVNVVAFEPHFANYFQLCVNVMLNNLQDKIMPICLAFTDKKAVSRINLASVDFGTAMASLHTANLPAFKQGMMAYDIDSFIQEFNFTPPNHIKIDVNGTELDIIKGGQKTLGNSRIKSTSIELIDTDQAQLTSVNQILEKAGLNFIHKKYNPTFASLQTKSVMNFLYRR